MLKYDCCGVIKLKFTLFIYYYFFFWASDPLAYIYTNFSETEILHHTSFNQIYFYLLI